MRTNQSKYGRRFDEEFKREVAALASRPESIDARVFTSHAQARSAILWYIEVFYNRQHLHGAPGCLLSRGLRAQPELKTTSTRHSDWS